MQGFTTSQYFIEPCGLLKVSRKAMIIATAIYCGGGEDIIQALKRSTNASGLSSPANFYLKNSHAILKFGAKMSANAIALAHFRLNYNTRSRKLACKGLRLRSISRKVADKSFRFGGELPKAI